AANRGLACGNQWRCALRQIDIETRTKADHAKALSSADRLASAYEADDAPCNKAGNLHDGNTRASSCDHDAIALVVDACLVDVGVKELARVINYFLNFPGDWAAVYMAVEHAHEDRNARQRLVTEAKVRWRHRTGDLVYTAIRGRDHQAITYWCYARRVTEEIGTPDRCQRAEPSERTPQPEQNEANQGEGPDEWVALRAHSDDLRAKLIGDQHAAILLCRVSRSLKRSRSSLANLSLNQRWVAVRCALLLFPDSGKFLTRLFGFTLTIPHAGIETGHGKQR